jgi:hypothetical protein
MTTQRNRPTADGHPILQWHNGKTTARHAGKPRFAEGFVGFTVEAGRWEAFDRTAVELAVPKVEIKHRRPGTFEVKEHWSLGDEMSVYPLTAGPVRATMTIAARTPQDSARRAGIVARWDGDKTRLAFWVLPVFGGLVHQAPLILTARSRMTDYLYGALLDHCTRVCDAVEAHLGQSASIMPWDIALPLIPDEQREFGKGEQTTVTPLASGHGPSISAEDVQALMLPDGWSDFAAGLAEEAQAWALDEVQRAAEQTGEEAA